MSRPTRTTALTAALAVGAGLSLLGVANAANLVPALADIPILSTPTTVTAPSVLYRDPTRDVIVTRNDEGERVEIPNDPALQQSRLAAENVRTWATQTWIDTKGKVADPDTRDRLRDVINKARGTLRTATAEEVQALTQELYDAEQVVLSSHTAWRNRWY